ncbi:MAG TPA: FG-GAP-like repeat-containing protein [Verrucomicrobiae bacterium]|nr:FG-GAP-like repeat-containing protein [Verrucomicrobiae bacterium]
MLALAVVGCRKGEDADPFTRLSNLGKSQLEQGNGPRAVQYFQQALQLKPSAVEAHLNLANAHLLANQTAEAIRVAGDALRLDGNSAAAHYIIGCAWLRAGDATNALQSLSQSQKLDQAVTALNFQLGLAHERLGHAEEALLEFQTVIRFEPEHPAAHYRLSQLLVRMGRQQEAADALKAHQAILATKPGQPSDVALFEKCKHTIAKLPFKLEQPLAAGIKVVFTDATKAMLPEAARFRGPLGVIDLAHDGRNSLFVREGDGFRLLSNSGGAFTPGESSLPGAPGANYQACLVGDLQNDGTEDAVLLGDKGCQVFKFTTNGVVTDVTRAAAIGSLTAIDGALIDFDYTGKLGLLALQPDGKGPRYFRNFSSEFAMFFSELNVTSGLPVTMSGAAQIALEDLNGDELLDLIVARAAESPLVFTRQRGGPFGETNLGAALPTAPLIATGDLNNDSLPDVIAATKDKIEIIFGGIVPRATLPLGGFPVSALTLVDFDNDGWLDLVASGNGLRVWRNLGASGFGEVTTALGLDKVKGSVQFVAAADFDGDCDTDLALAVEGAGLRLLRNDGGNANRQLKLRLAGKRSNASGLGVRLEVTAGGLRSWRTVKRLPIELGVAKHSVVDSVAVRWADGFVNHDEIQVDKCAQLSLEEIQRELGSCPYLYAWDGARFKHVTDLLGASPIGLPLNDTRFIDADPAEFVWLGDEIAFPPRGGSHVLQVTEELREVLYLDEAKLVVVDHPPGTEVHTTGKLVPGKPFPPHEIVTLHRRQPLLRAVDQEGDDVTPALQQADRQMVSPTKLRAQQLRGLAEPHAVTLDFGPLDSTRPLVLALTGWLRFGGGMANVSASHTPGLPFPFPTLEAETANGDWKPVDVVVGAPAGKTKNIIVDLSGKLPAGTKRLRLATAFEIHWDCIALFEKRDNSETRITSLRPTRTDLHGRGISEFEPLPWFLPRSPDYVKVHPYATWTLAVAGWCTRYGAVDELIASRDNALALLNVGDELTLEFATAALPPRPAGSTRDFFFYSVGWDKDADFHCKLGWQVEPLPWHGMDDQRYGKQPRPAFENDAWMQKFNTRWVGPRAQTRR